MLRVEREIAGERVVLGAHRAHAHEHAGVGGLEEGTGTKASIPGYRVAGKTGTAKIAMGGGYSDDRYFAVFAGVAPARNPRLAAVVVIDEPSAGRTTAAKSRRRFFGR